MIELGGLLFGVYIAGYCCGLVLYGLRKFAEKI
jgi:hypothetical protein